MEASMEVVKASMEVVEASVNVSMEFSVEDSMEIVEVPTDLMENIM